MFQSWGVGEEFSQPDEGGAGESVPGGADQRPGEGGDDQGAGGGAEDAGAVGGGQEKIWDRGKVRDEIF